MKKRAAAFEGFDLRSFWKTSKYALERYVDDPLTPAKLTRVERVLKVALPASYVELMRVQNGGVPARTRHRTTERTSWAEDHIAIAGIFSIGNARDKSLCGARGSQFMIDEWGYPPIGVYFADCPSAGHDMMCLDYRACGPAGEPTIVHVDQERDYKITFIAATFESFIWGLEDHDAFSETDEAKVAQLLWRPQAIQVKVARDLFGMRKAPHIVLTQKLRKDDTGWTMIKIELPASWVVSKAVVRNGVVVIVRKMGQTYELGPNNIGDLSFAILNDGDKTNSELEQLWEKYARAKSERRSHG